ncbi:MAG: hypothetical protein H6550_02985 [Chitinophagales bacterium]|nr:hypothetical protein [Chitinophagales bacterium]
MKTYLKRISILLIIIATAIIIELIWSGFTPEKYDMLVSISGAMFVFIVVWIYNEYIQEKKKNLTDIKGPAKSRPFKYCINAILPGRHL